MDKFEMNIIELAKEAGYDEHHATYDTRLERFAALVRDQERAEREWVDLTDDEIAYVAGGSPYDKSIARAVIAAFKEKNK